MSQAVWPGRRPRAATTWSGFCQAARSGASRWAAKASRSSGLPLRSRSPACGGPWAPAADASARASTAAGHALPARRPNGLEVRIELVGLVEELRGLCLLRVERPLRLRDLVDRVRQVERGRRARGIGVDRLLEVLARHREALAAERGEAL